MIEIITKGVAMPPFAERRYHNTPDDLNGAKWTVMDTQENVVAYKGKYKESAIACHNLNKKYYQSL